MLGPSVMQNRLDMRLTLSASMVKLVAEGGCSRPPASGGINLWEEDDTEYLRDAVTQPANKKPGEPG